MEDRLLSRSAVLDNGCWYWLGRVEPNGYAKIGVYSGYKGGKSITRNLWVHRVAYEVLGCTTIPEGHQIDHRCRQPLCINPNHLECVPGIENTHARVAKKRRKDGRYGN